MPIIGGPRSFHDKFKFLVEIDGVLSAAFNKCGELSAEFAKIEYSEGGTLIPNKTPGRMTFADVTLERGVASDLDLFLWFSQTGIASANFGLPEPAYKRDLDIVQKDRDNTTLRRWHLNNAWVLKFVAGEWDNDADEKAIEMVTLTYDFFELVFSL
ncbi:hypothetical protein LCGC14_0413110 [marine sediment metagenome]|uniref:Phage tail protein n=1 Tax=marine sediment metagenome TaxID=412755 RepID=A0A0F9SYZ2_9ZZZZ